MAVDSAAQEAQILNSLAQQGKLSGVSPTYLQLIAQEESGYEAAGAGINSKNYGGYFGLSTATEPSAILLSQSPQSFETQAEAAASIFAAGLKASGGNPYGAENYYQTGSTEGNAIIPTGGSGLFAEYLTGKVPAGVRGPSTGSPQSSGTPTVLPGTGSSTGSSSGGGKSWALQLQDVLNPSSSNAGILGIPGALGEWGARLGLVAVGLILFLGGLAVIGVSSLLPRLGGAPAKAAIGAIKGATA